MKTEYEIRVLEINKEEIIKKLEELGPHKKAYLEKKRYEFYLKPQQNATCITQRTNVKKATLAYKDIVSNTIDGTKEVEFEIEDVEKANEFLERIGFESRSYQENNRIQYILNGVEIDIDSWPMIPTYMEIEGNSEEEVLNVQKLLGIEGDKVTALNCDDIYRQIYNIDISTIKELKFKN